MKERQKHGGTIADGITSGEMLVLQVVGVRPKERPYLAIYRPGHGNVIATVENANALRGLARAILRALGDVP